MLGVKAKLRGAMGVCACSLGAKNVGVEENSEEAATAHTCYMVVCYSSRNVMKACQGLGFLSK